MLKSLFYHLSLFWLCFRLLISLINFSIKIIFHKISEKNWLIPLFAIIYFSLLAFNLYLFKEKTTPKVITQDIEVSTLNLENINYQNLTENEIKTQIEYYSDLENQGIKNFNLYLNLAALHQKDNPKISQEYLKKAQKIDPNNSLFQ